MKQLSLRKLKKLDGYHGRLFFYEEEASKWLERMQMKMGSSYTYDTRPHKIENGINLVLAFFHKG